ncbi:YceI family protein [Chitinophagaceae bacterium LB-8]|jgi:YceI-like protein|uniref:YceI family protein n=1 Tax=Paraflavisolibacter caeni TaxID=2982496 RepID=A0A9X3BFR3_9BACT|nr:YceI family protein [Paraflavisolibacter caeni]MCU7549474.1 YceI family protein [Paraflavisolibacter caeni]
MKNLALLLLLFLYNESGAQTFLTRNGFIGFYSKTPLEDIRAENKQTYGMIDATKKNIAFTLLVKGFTFQKQLMQTHFNENYAESDRYPKANFVGTYSGDVDVSKNGIYPVVVKGQLTFHGVTKDLEVPASIEVQDEALIGKSEFKLIPADFDIEIPSIVREKIAQQMDVRVNVKCNKIK